MVALYLGEPVPGLEYCACSVTGMADMTGTLNGIKPSLMLLFTPVLFPALTSENVCCEKGLLPSEFRFLKGQIIFFGGKRSYSLARRQFHEKTDTAFMSVQL